MGPQGGQPSVHQATALKDRLISSEFTIQDAENVDLDYCCEDEEDRRGTAARTLCQSLAAAVVLQQQVPGEMAAMLAALPATPDALSLGLAGDEGPWLVHLPVMEKGRVVWSPAAPAGTLEPRTAAWDSFQNKRCLLWRCGQGSLAPGSADWSALLASHASSAKAMLTVPLVAERGGCAALGTATFVLQKEPAMADVNALFELGEGLARSIAHHTKHVWEESLDFLQQVIPHRIVQHMMAAVLSLGPLAAADAPVARAANRVAPTATAETFFTPQAAAWPSNRISGQGCLARGPALLTRASSGDTACSGGSCAVCLAPAAPAEPAFSDGCSSSSNNNHISSGLPDGIKTVHQKWNLEFADPVLEGSFKSWFNSMQTRTVADLEVIRYIGMLAVVLILGLAVRGSPSWGDVLALSHGLLSVAALAVFMLLDTAWYIAHRSTVVACVRIGSAALLLIHVYLDPGFYSGSLLKALTGSCSLTLIINCFRNRLRFSNHLLVQLAKLYLCSMANAFIYSDLQRATHAYLPLATTSLLQLASALLPSLAVYCLEAGTRRKFLHARLASAAGMVQSCQAAAPSGDMVPAESNSSSRRAVASK